MKKKSQFITNIKKTWKYIKEAKIYLILYAFASILEAVLSIIIPLIGAKIILNLTNALIDELLGAAVLVLITEIIMYVAWFMKGYFYHKIYQKTLVGLQVAVSKEMLKLKIKEVDNKTSELFIDRLNKDTQDISGLFMEYTYWISQVLSNIGVLIAIFVLNKPLFIYAVLTSIVIFLINKKRINKQYEVQKSLKIIQEKKTGLTSELVRGIRDIKVLNADENILEQTTDKIVESSNEELKMLNIRRIYNYIENNIRTVSEFIFIVLGCILYKNNLLTIASFVIIYNYQQKVRSLLTGIVYILEFNKKFVVSSNRVYEILDNTFEKESFGNTKVKKLVGNIRFENVEFGYNENKKILNKMSFEIEPNQKVAFVGKSGVGKTTILSLITKLYNIDKGNIYLDDININDLDKDSLRNNMSLITQNPYIFNFTIKENLLMAKKDASLKEIKEACKMARIHDYIMTLPDKYDTVLGENGIILSGGQKQRLAIARALLLKTEIILFDEATSALDNETQSEIQEAIDNLKGEYTILIVAHRLSTILNCDKIFFIDNGKVVDSGSHKELLTRCIEYKNLYEQEMN